MEILQYQFMQRACLVGILIAVTAPCMGIIIVLKRFSLVGDTLAHSSLAGIALGLVLGFNPIIGSILAACFAVCSLEVIKRYFSSYQEIGLVVLTSAAVGTAAILSDFVSNAANFNSFLFGSIVAISDLEFYLMAGLCLAIILVFWRHYYQLFYLVFDGEAAHLAGVKAERLSFLFMLLVAITIAISARTVGTLMISSLLVLPVAAAFQVAGSYRQTVIYAIAFSLFAVIIGLSLSYYGDLKPGGTIVLSSIFILFIALLRKKSM